MPLHILILNDMLSSSNEEKMMIYWVVIGIDYSIDYADSYWRDAEPPAIFWMQDILAFRCLRLYTDYISMRR